MTIIRQGQAWSDPVRRGLTPQLSNGIRQGGSSPDAAKIEAAYIGFGTYLNNYFQRATSAWRGLAKVIDSDDLIHTELFLDSVPKMRLWEGDKVLNQIRGENLSIQTRPFEASCVIGKGDIINDRYGIYLDKIKQMGQAYDWHMMEMVIGMLIAGLQGTALGTTYDGQNLIDTDHTFLGNGTGTQQSNKVTGPFSATVYQAAWNAFLTFKDEYNTPINVITPDLDASKSNRKMYLLHGPANRIAVRQVLTQEWIPSLQQNLDAGSAIPVLLPWLTAGTYTVMGVPVTLTGTEWFLLPENSAAVLIQRKRQPQFLSVEEGEFTFRTGKYLYGLESEDGAAYGMWQEVVGGPGA